ncbi:kinase-like domain-containing protein [Ilyonectria robusta]|uniref:kinase-like domain-containing protein n=1 Tax=Ilyonectria robusta TaxID=1079257 RepID=UPI001E8D2F4B|nr:kinase-like domain-containing protein [Ilyonectria robusta]KAH8672212.1 kinase-like domain-containing protein [Ilyonectria robusta]
MGDNNLLPQVIISSVETDSDQDLGYTYDGDGLVPIVDDQNTTLGDLIREYEICGIDGRYWTPKLLRHVLSRDRVEAELKKTEQTCGELDIPQLVNAVCPQDESTGSKSYLKIFALLALGKQQRYLAKFIRDGVCDEKLPIIIGAICKEFHLHRETSRPWRKAKDSAELENCGAFGAVTLVEFHPTSHSFDAALTGVSLVWKASHHSIKMNRSRIAIKTLHDEKFNDEKQFRREFDQLNRFSGFVHKHLVTTLGAFKYGSQWSFVFPGAACDLDMCLEEQNPPWNPKTVRWASDQLWGIMGALDTIHNPRHLHASGRGEKRYGRHGDIKCDNILCFQDAVESDQHVLVISDFGLSDFNRDTSRSNIPNKTIPAVPGYRPPECDIKGGLISRAYDIWTVGCLFLEFLTWLMGGPTSLDQFRRQRETMFINGSKNDIFFSLMTCEEKGPGVYVAQVKVEVTDWIQQMRREMHCSRFIHDVLDLIQEEILVVLENNDGQSSGTRSSSGELSDALRRIRNACAKDSYCIQGVAVDRCPPTIPAVEVDLNEFATKMILDQKPQLKDHKGETRRSMLPNQFQEMDN